MKITIDKTYAVPSYETEENFTVVIQQGVQRFYLRSSGPKGETEWMAKMFRKALRNHDKERDVKRSRRNKTEEGLRNKAERRQ